MKTILVDAVYCLVIKTPDGFSVFPEMLALLETYPNRKIVLTGANDEQYETFNLKTVPYDVFTMKHDPEKTDPKYYETLLERYQLQPSDAVYFEHGPEAVTSARSVGIMTYQYDDATRDLAALKAFLDGQVR